jgi:hypothetical protein
MAQQEAVVPVASTSKEPEPATSGIVPQLQNVVATVNLGVKLDLKKIAISARNAEYNPKASASHRVVCYCAGHDPKGVCSVSPL